MTESSEPAESDAALRLRHYAPEILTVLILFLSVVWFIDHHRLKEQISESEQARLNVERKIGSLQSSHAKTSYVLRGCGDLTHTDALINTGARVNFSATGVSWDRETSPAEFLAGMSHLKSLHDLKGITIRSPGLTSECLRQISDLQSLRYLYLTGDCLLDADAEVIQILKSYPNLYSLELAEAKLGDDVFQQIAQLKQLHGLFLRRFPVTDDQVEMLSNCRQLVYLYLTDAEITDRSVPSLSELTHLRELLLPESVTQDARDQLSEALPECKILYGRPRKI